MTPATQSLEQLAEHQRTLELDRLKLIYGSKPRRIRVVNEPPSS
jgi:hypothetical protein